MMIDLFNSPELENERQCRLKELLTMACEVPKIQSKIIGWQNNKRFNMLKQRKSLREKINSWFEGYGKGLDSSSEKFIRDFPTEFFQKTFELAMASFLSDCNFELEPQKTQGEKKHSQESQPDLLFKVNDEEYFLECTTRMTSLIDKYVCCLINFDNYFQIVKRYFFKDNEGSTWHSTCFLHSSWNSLESKEKNKISQSLKLNDSETLTKIEEWIFLNIYVQHCFPEIVPDNVKRKLNKIKLSGKFLVLTEANIKFFSKCLAKVILDKLEKPYFSKENSRGLIAVSLDCITPDFGGAFGFIDLCRSGTLFSREPGNIYANLFNEEIKACFELKSKEKQEKISHGLKNLHAILIDNSWLNWFPDDKSLHANFPKGYRNAYIILYNNTKETKILEGRVYTEHQINLGDILQFKGAIH